VLLSVAVNLYHLPLVPEGLDRPQSKAGGVPVSFVKAGAVVIDPIATVKAVSQVP